MTFLGHVITDKGVDVDPKKVEALKKWLRPLIPLDIQRFLGLAKYYLRFVRAFLLLVPR